MVEQKRIIKALSQIPYSKMLGVEPIFIGEEFTLKMPYIQTNIGNPTLPALHGGAISGLMEIAAITQLFITTNGKSLSKPIGINVDYLRKGLPKDTYARAVVFKQGTRVANVRVRSWQEDYNKPIAVMHGHYLTDKSD